MDELRAEFVAETRETLDRIGEALVGWEAHPGEPARIDEIFRFVHTVKGSCGFLDLPRIAFLADAAETVLAAVRAGERTVDATLVGAMLALIDRIALLADALDDGRTVPPEDSDGALVAALNATGPAPAAVAEVAALPARSVRVAVPLLETMLDQVSELVLVRNELARSGATGIDGFARLTTLVGSLRESVTRTRMQPIERLFAALPRLVRDTAHDVGKTVELSISGEDVEVDREMVEAIRDPLVHIVRNAIDHGIEDAATRAELGKPAAGKLSIAAYQSGNQVSIEVGDDGGGIDTQRLVARAVSSGNAGAARLSLKDATNLVFQPGLSTAAEVTNISGRGVGMDVVRANVERLGGAVTLVNRPGEGLTVRLCAPLTLSIVIALMVEAGGHRFAIPRSAIVEVVALGKAARIEPLGSGLLAIVRNEPLPFRLLGAVMGGEGTAPMLLAIVATVGGVKFALGIDAFGEQEELVVRPMAPALGSAGVYAGQSLGDVGLPIAVLDIAGIARRCGIEQRRLIEAVAPIAVVEPVQVLRAAAFDGSIVAVRAALVERVVMTARADWVQAGDRWHASIAGEMLAAVMIGEPGDGRVATIIVGDGARRVALAVAEVGELVALGETTPVGHAYAEALTRIGGAWVLLLDGFALLAHAASPVPEVRPVALLDVEPTPWATALLAPMIEAAGYEVCFRANATGSALVVRGDREALIVERGSNQNDSGSDARGEARARSAHP